MMTHPFHRRKQAAAILITLSVAWPAGAAPVAPRMVSMQGQVAPQVRSAALMSHAQANEIVQLGLAVKIDQTLLDQTLEGIYGKNAPKKKRFLSSEEFAQRFGLAEKRQALKDFARGNGLSVDGADEPNSMMVKVSGTAGVVEKTFGLALNHYRAADGREFRAHATEPIIPATLVPNLAAVTGLSNLSGLYHPHLQMRASNAAPVNPSVVMTTGPGGTFSPADIKNTYGLTGTSLSGAGQTLALFELDGYLQTDITAYMNTFGLTHTPITYVPVDGTPNTQGAGQIEVTLDIEMMVALAPGATQILVYNDANNGVGIFDEYDKIATDNLAKSVSSSWGGFELQSTAFDDLENSIFQRMAAQGQSFFAASGDSGAYDDGTTISVDDPASQPYVTGVGGTTISNNVGSTVERTWNSCGSGKCLQGSGGSTGGGVSVHWPIPSYQVGTSGLSSQTKRNVPDVSLNADPSPGYGVYLNGGFVAVGGTSAAAPLWAAFVALLNQQSVTNGAGVLGFANPTLYQLGNNAANYAANFYDPVGGDNGGYSAVAGYDNTTGIGSFKGAALINALTNQLVLLAKEQLLNVYAFPNPWDTRKGYPHQITFANLPDDATVKIYTISGFWVKTLTPLAGSTVWDLNNDNGKRVASGLYFYTVKTPSAFTKGEIAIIK